MISHPGTAGSVRAAFAGSAPADGGARSGLVAPVGPIDRFVGPSVGVFLDHLSRRGDADLGVVRRPALGVEQHLGGLVADPELAVARAEVGDRVLPRRPDLVRGGVLVDTEDVVPAGAHFLNLESTSLHFETTQEPSIFWRSTSIW